MRLSSSSSSSIRDASDAPAYELALLQRVDEHLFVAYCTLRVKRPFVQTNRTMVILRHHKRELTLINPVRLHPEGEAQLRRLGSFSRIIRLAPQQEEGASGALHDLYYLRAFSRIRRWSPCMPRPDDNDELVVHRLLTQNDHSILPGCHVFFFQGGEHVECALLLLREVDDGNLLVTAEALQSHRDNPFVNVVTRAAQSSRGLLKGAVVVPPSWLRSMSGNSRQKDMRNDFERLLRLDFDKVVGSSGVMIHAKAKEHTVLAVERAFPPGWDC